MVGGISRTAQYKGFRFDIGGHRFFTKIAPVEELWHEILGDEFISVPAAVADPLQRASSSTIRSRPANALRGLGLLERRAASSLSYLQWHACGPIRSRRTSSSG